MNDFNGFFNLTPNWSQVMIPSKAEKELPGFKFKGVGLYITPSDNLIVTKCIVNLKYLDSGEDTYLFQCYNETDIIKEFMKCLEGLAFLPKFYDKQDMSDERASSKL